MIYMFLSNNPSSGDINSSNLSCFKMHAWSTSMLLLLHSAFILSVVKLLLKGEVGVCALNSHGNYIVNHGKSWKNHGIVSLNFCGNPDLHQYLHYLLVLENCRRGF